jgi:hypothetical protein
MGYRKQSNEQHSWKQWLAKSRADLINAGLPDFLWAERLRWLHFVEHGYDHQTGWKPEMLAPVQLEALRKFIEREYGTNATQHFRIL